MANGRSWRTMGQSRMDQMVEQFIPVHEAHPEHRVRFVVMVDGPHPWGKDQEGSFSIHIVQETYYQGWQQTPLKGTSYLTTVYSTVRPSLRATRLEEVAYYLRGLLRHHCSDIKVWMGTAQGWRVSLRDLTIKLSDYLTKVGFEELTLESYRGWLAQCYGAKRLSPDDHESRMAVMDDPLTLVLNRGLYLFPAESNLDQYKWSLQKLSI